MRTHKSYGFALAFVLLCGCQTPWDGRALAHRQPAASVTAHAPSRPRLEFQPHDPGKRLQASLVELVVVDARVPQPATQTDAPVLTLAVPTKRTEVALPAALGERVAARLAALTEREGPRLLLEARITHLLVWREQEARLIAAEVTWTLSEATLGPLYSSSAQSGYRMDGPPYDRAELDEVHVATLLQSLDAFLAKPEVIELVNLKLAAMQHAASLERPQI